LEEFDEDFLRFAVSLDSIVVSHLRFEVLQFTHHRHRIAEVETGVLNAYEISSFDGPS
jgi:hypothetical protein